MAKNLKLKIKNTQLAKALKIKGVGKKKAPAKEKVKPSPPPTEEEASKKRKIKARAKSAFLVVPEEKVEEQPPAAPPPVAEEAPAVVEKEAAPAKQEESEEQRRIRANIKANLERAQAARERPARRKEERPPPPPAAKSPTAQPAAKEKTHKRVRDFRDFKPKQPGMRPFDARQRQRAGITDNQSWRRRKKRSRGGIQAPEQPAVRPKELAVRLPITIKDLAMAMKLKASELITKLFMQGVTVTLNDFLDDETTIQLLGHEFDCDITIDTSEEERIRITDKTIGEEIAATEADKLTPRSPVVAFMGHVDHGKTSLIDWIRKSNVAAGEAGAITQHIGAFQCQTPVGALTILDTPGHEAFTAMRARGADVTDVVILVVAGDEGVRPQTEEAVQHAKAAGVTILVAINKSDKPEFNAENVYRQLSTLDLLPEAWGGSIVTVNCSAITGVGIPELLEMIALQAEVLELHANPNARARGTVIESEMHKGLGAVATVLVQNGTLSRNDAVVFDDLWGRIKTMQDEHGVDLVNAGPSIPVAITGLSGLPEAGSDFIVVQNEKEAAAIAEVRSAGKREQRLMQRKRRVSESLLEEAVSAKKTLHLIIRADVQGSLEALRASLEKIVSDKAKVNIIFSGIGAITESDIELAVASDATILGFHTQVESHADPLIKKHGIQVRLHEIIYHAIDDVKALMTGSLDKIAEEKESGTATVRAIFKSSQLGIIAGCFVNEGTIHRTNKVRLLRGGEEMWRGNIASIKRQKEDVREVRADFECGIVLEGFNDVQEGDVLQAYEIVYTAQEL